MLNAEVLLTDGHEHFGSRFGRLKGGEGSGGDFEVKRETKRD